MFQEGTAFHIDRTQAENIAFATTPHHMEEALATWIFIPPSSLDKVRLVMAVVSSKSYHLKYTYNLFEL